ncbi:MAG: phosphoribosylaminoimidazolesuccinocarboxamide synthase [Oscillospiraceae bacterium]|nr:phosphoribosylaminoimidazolesuccinocarboxamide synthase [Oscillospiraceae bacterium]
MRLIKEGKTKVVYELPDGNILLKFKDDATGKDGVFDPGANQVGLKIEGLGLGGLRVSAFLFEELRKAGVPTHYISADFAAATMTVKPVTQFGHGVEFVCRFKAVGSFLRRYGLYAVEGQPLDALVESTLKDDGRDDPPITQDSLEALGIVGHDEFDYMRGLTKKVSRLVRDVLSKKGAELYDIKVEFGRLRDGSIALIDEISPGSMRAYNGGEALSPMDMIRLIVG